MHRLLFFMPKALGELAPVIHLLGALRFVSVPPVMPIIALRRKPTPPTKEPLLM